MMKRCWPEVRINDVAGLFVGLGNPGSELIGVGDCSREEDVSD